MSLSPTLTSPSADDGRPVAAAENYGPYEVIGPLGAGGMGLVLEARDPALGRHVALKLLTPQRAWTAVDGGTRLVFEAQAMARLAHPNVVTVFEVGRVDEEVYVAMELVRGTTLRNWLREPRRWREIVEMFLGAGRGLVAAHDAGLVHRDFKPDNVLIGADGRPRVTDFGLVVDTSSHEDAVLTEIAEARSDATFRGSIVGTPGYMSLEQWSGGAVDARTDQFAFCVSLWTALCGQRPFAGTAPAEIRAAVRTGAIAEPPRGRAPRWLLALVRRGLARDPGARWPSMAALLDAIARRMRIRRAVIAATAITAAVAIASVATAAVVGARGAATCAPPVARLAAVWSDAQRAPTLLRLIAADPVQGAARYGKIAVALDTAASGWSAMHVDACRATRVEGRQSDALLDRRMACLDRWLGELRNTVEVVTAVATRAEVDQAVRAATSLASLERCADTRALGEALAPANAVDRATAAALGAQIQAVEVAQRAGRYDGLADRAAALAAAARQLHLEPTLAAALVVQARVLLAQQAHTVGEAPLRELALLAARNHDDRDEAFAWMNLAPIPGQANLIEPARAAVLRAGEPFELQIDLMEREASLLTDSARSKEALPLLARARALLERAGADQPGSPLGARLASILYETGQNQLVSGDYDAANASYRASIERRRRVFGADSVDEADALYHIAVAQMRAGKLDEALPKIREASRIYATRLGDSPPLIMSYTAEGRLLAEQEQWTAALELYDRAEQMQRRTPNADDLTLVKILMSRNVALDHFGKFDEELTVASQVIALLEAHGDDQKNLALALSNRADLLTRQGRCDEAVHDLDRSLAIFARTVDPSAQAVIYALVGKATCLVLTGRAAEAIPPLERMLTIRADVGDAYVVAVGKAYLGRARVETGRDVAGGLAMVRAARATLAALPDSAADVRWIDRWLATRR